MNFIKKAILILPLLGLAITSCDNIDEDERYIQVEQVTPKRAVLLEEFTGQYCRNCPDAHEVIAQLKEQYPDAFIPVSIHAGPIDNSLPADSSKSVTNQGLKQAEGDTYASMWDINVYPRGVFNRTSGVLSSAKWSAQIIEEMQKEAKINIELSAAYDSISNKVVVNTTLKPTENITGNLQLWLVESNIVSLQILSTGKRNKNYVHNHVFRTSINGTNGQPVSLNANIYGNYTNDVELRQYWEPANLSVVAFVYNDSGVLNAAEVAVTVPSAE